MFRPYLQDPDGVKFYIRDTGDTGDQPGRYGVLSSDPDGSLACDTTEDAELAAARRWDTEGGRWDRSVNPPAPFDADGGYWRIGAERVGG